MPIYKPPLIFSIHGIRTKAGWQKPLAQILKQEGILYEPYNFGYYGIFHFLFQPSNEKMIDKFYEFYSSIISKEKYNIDLDNNAKRPSIIVHSFGSYIVGYCLLKYPDVIFDKLILCGSILPSNFDWATILLRDQVTSVLNEYGLNDVWSKIVGRFVPRTGSSGADGFRIASSQLSEKRFEYFKHSDYFRGQHVRKYWLPFLQKTPCNFVVIHGHDFQDIKLFSDTLDITGGVIDRDCFGSLEHYDEVEIPRGLSLQWIKINPDIYTFIFDQSNNAVKGYINAMPVDDATFDKIKNGELEDNEIMAEGIIPFMRNQTIKIYLMSIAISPFARSANEGLLYLAFEKLMNGFVNKLVYYFTNHNIKVTHFLAVGWTNEGRRLCKIMGMEQVGLDRYSNPIYMLDLENSNTTDKGHLLESIRKLVLTYKSYQSV